MAENKFLLSQTIKNCQMEKAEKNGNYEIS